MGRAEARGVAPDGDKLLIDVVDKSTAELQICVLRGSGALFNKNIKGLYVLGVIFILDRIAVA
ncbi:hypothetical protein P4N68_05730 [Corynebacterium felinum]|uniref:Uncharacterized protein n=1 Tax=Corynebacterium felinum TaxID=131318 RepID=A0ABU2B5V2_9CORY|nr:hypothetical protein [Corynebacterium felinum]MDF5820580.1 hypothetical protein [Corynebacterium felinum]MDR7353651.1 hypothetical protein [Corynebacterium felinum]WJY95830.1 hypothetical protein CFELI_11190 [Corynebacterium felinum]